MIKTQKEDDEMNLDLNSSEKKIIWTQSMPDRRVSQRRELLDRREQREPGRMQFVPDLGLVNEKDRRGIGERRIKLIITGRAQGVGGSFNN